jgi:hypothetical protein
MSEYTPGSMDISQHQGTYKGVVSLFKWSTIAIVILLILMAAFLL